MLRNLHPKLLAHFLVRRLVSILLGQFVITTLQRDGDGPLKLPHDSVDHRLSLPLDAGCIRNLSLFTDIQCKLNVQEHWLAGGSPLSHLLKVYKQLLRIVDLVTEPERHIVHCW